MPKTRYIQLVQEILDGRMLCVSRVTHLMHYLLKTASLDGAVVEFGCYTGRTAALMAYVSGKTVHLYDSFEGLPERGDMDKGCRPVFQKGKLACTPEQVETYFRDLNPAPPEITKGWFEKLKPEQLPNQIKFAHLDGDYHSSVSAGLELIYPRLVSGGVLLIDDYGWSGLPGVKAACDEYTPWCQEDIFPLPLTNSDAGQGVLINL